MKGLGGVLLDDIQESLPHCEKVLKHRASDIVFITRPIDKKKILFYNDRTANFAVDEEFQKLWRSSTVDAIDDAKIEEYLEKQGIRSMQDHGIRKPIMSKRKKAPLKKRQFKRPRDNEHLADILETYEGKFCYESVKKFNFLMRSFYRQHDYTERRPTAKIIKPLSLRNI